MSHNTELTVRQAGIEDVDAVAPLFDAYRQFYEYPSDISRARDYLTARLEQQESTVLIASTDTGEAVGFTQLYPTFCSLDMDRIFVLYDLYVSPQARRSGVAQALLRRAEQVGRENGASRLDLSTARTNTKAQTLYESLGWVQDEVYLYYSLVLRGQAQ